MYLNIKIFTKYELRDIFRKAKKSGLFLRLLEPPPTTYFPLSLADQTNGEGVHRLRHSYPPPNSSSRHSDLI